MHQKENLPPVTNMTENDQNDCHDDDEVLVILHEIPSGICGPSFTRLTKWAFQVIAS